MKQENTTEKSKGQKKILRYQQNLYTTFIISLLVPVVITIMLFMVYTIYFMNKREEQRMSDMVESVSKNIEMKLNEAENIVRTYYSDPDVFKEVEYLNNPKLYQYYDTLTKSRMETEYSRIITSGIYMSSQPITSVVFFPMNEMSWTGFYLGREQSTLKEFPYAGYHKEQWFIEAIENPKDIVFSKLHNPDYFQKGEESRVYSCISAVRDMNNNRTIGVVKIDIDYENLQDSMDVLVDDQKQGFILSKNGETLIQSSTFQNIQNLERTKWQKKSMMISETNLKLTYLDSKSAFYRGLLFIFILMVLLIAGSAWLAFEIYRRRMQEMVDDVRSITEGVEQAGNGNLNQRIQTTSQNEMGEIATAVNKMMDNLQTYIEQEYLLVIQNQKAEYRALQSQINPHFFYNTLNGFVALNRMGETKTLEKSIISLAKLFRYTCKAQDVMDVQSELEFLKRYLELEKLKYEERLEYYISMDEQSRKQLIPKLLLQPVVENSIVHGMGMSADLITIIINAMCQDVRGIGKICIIQVSDNGCGFDMNNTKNEKEHIGIKNVQSRVELFCREAICHVGTEIGAGTTTTFVFPIED